MKLLFFFLLVVFCINEDVQYSVLSRKTISAADLDCSDSTIEGCPSYAHYIGHHPVEFSNVTVNTTSPQDFCSAHAPFQASKNGLSLSKFFYASTVAFNVRIGIYESDDGVVTSMTKMIYETASSIAIAGDGFWQGYDLPSAENLILTKDKFYHICIIHDGTFSMATQDGVFVIGAADYPVEFQDEPLDFHTSTAGSTTNSIVKHMVTLKDVLGNNEPYTNNTFTTDKGYVYLFGEQSSFRTYSNYMIKKIKYNCKSAEAGKRVTIGLYDGQVKLIAKVSFIPVCDSTDQFVTLSSDIEPQGNLKLAVASEGSVEWYASATDNFLTTKIVFDYSISLPPALDFLSATRGKVIGSISFFVRDIAGCFGIEVNGTNVCSGRGKCIGTDICECNDDYHGGYCQYGKDDDLVVPCTSSDDGLDIAIDVNGVCVHLIRSDVQTNSFAELSCRKLFYNGHLYTFTSREDDVIHTTAIPSHVDYWIGARKKANYAPSVVDGSQLEWVSSHMLETPLVWTGFDEEDDGQVCVKYRISESSQYPLRSDSKCSILKPYLCMYTIPVCNEIKGNDEMVCSGNGYCVKDNTCICKEGYSGENCEIASCYGKYDYDSSVCNMKGNCTAYNECVCDDKWKGDECLVHTCYGVRNDSALVCGGKGSCSPTTHLCTCPNGYLDDCTIALCYDVRGDNEAEVCSGYGTCQVPNKCVCDDYHGGLNCSEPKCNGYLNSDTEYVCTNKMRGTCVFDEMIPGMSKCSCENGYSGDSCELFTCQDDCNGNGKCVDYNECKCDSGYYDPYCDNWKCNGVSKTLAESCGQYGECISNETCSCTYPYYGPTCSDFDCGMYHFDDENACNGHGSCLGPNNCSCIEEWNGDNCGTLYCGYTELNDPNVCSGHGTCEWSGECNCTEGYRGTDCSYPICNGLDIRDADFCNNVGSCPTPGDCVCPIGEYTGAQCEFPICFDEPSYSGSVCSGRGQCDEPNVCTCTNADLWGGQECEWRKCEFDLYNDNAVCSATGDCQGDHTCLCDVSRYFGSSCEYMMCNGLNNNDGNVCSGNGVCDTMTGECACSMNYDGDNCELVKCNGVAEDQTHVCNGHGVCTGINTCECQYGWTGEHCGTYTCYGIPHDDSTVCNDGAGACIDVDHCACDTENYYGEECKVIKCNAKNKGAFDVCSGNGICEEDEEGMNKCFCADNFEGDNCEIHKCYGYSAGSALVCSGRGMCNVHDGTCTCTTAYYSGSYCHIAECNGLQEGDPLVCNGRGRCISGTGICECAYNYMGDFCDIEMCYGVSKLDTENVCNGNGYCLDGKCNCDSEYWIGIECEIPLCGSVDEITGKKWAKGDVEVCNGHGDCMDDHSCKCYEGYHGVECDKRKCYGKVKDDDSVEVCNGHGICNDVSGECVCNTNDKYKGPECNIPTCFGVPANNDMVCNGRGVCEGIDVCNCGQSQGLYLGVQCNIPTCNGVAVNDSNVCSGYGKCVDFKCVCDEGYEGENCKNEIPALISQVPAITSTVLFIIIIIIVIILCIAISIATACFVYRYCKPAEENIDHDKAPMQVEEEELEEKE